MMLMKIKTMMIQVSCSDHETASNAVCNLNKIKDLQEFPSWNLCVGMNKTKYGTVALAINRC